MTGTSHSVAPGAAGERLDVFLAKTLGSTRSQVQKLIALDLVKVNGKPERASYVVLAGDAVEQTEAPRRTPQAPPPDFPVLYEDNDILVIDKPAGIAVHPGAATHETATVADYARPRTTDLDPDRPGIIHRLDRDTSGILVIAKHDAAKTWMQAAFKKREVHKVYQLLVVGRLDKDAAVIKLPLGRDPARPLQQAVSAGGRDAVTAYEATRFYSGYTRVVARPETGRTHQLRVHFAALGHPVAGDIVYGPPKRPLGIRRQFLHASDIEFTAPSGELLKLHSPLPSDLQKVLDLLEAGE